MSDTGPASSPDRLDDAADLRIASDLLLDRLGRLAELEHRKRQVVPSDPEFPRLAREIEDLARLVLGTTGVQVELAEEAQAAAKAGRDDLTNRPIAELPPKRHAAGVLAAWRDAERRLQDAEPGSEVERDAREAVEHLRREYGDIVNRRSAD